MGEKFTLATESIQMEAEYHSRKQGKNEDVQNYINAKYGLFQLAFPNAQERVRVVFYHETTVGFLKKYVRDQMFCFDANCVEAFGAIGPPTWCRSRGGGSELATVRPTRRTGTLPIIVPCY